MSGGSPEPNHGVHSAQSMVPREARQFQGDRAGFVTRIIAVGIDFAIVVIGGLISATLLTLILLPILYRRFGTERPKGA